MGYKLIPIVFAAALLMLVMSQRQAEAQQPELPIQAAFFYPWFPETWSQSPAPFSHFTPDVPAGCDDTYPPPSSNACYYDSEDIDTIDEQLRQANMAHVEAFISSWWGQGHHTDDHLKKVMSRANNGQSPYRALRLAVYHEQEGQDDPTEAELADDLTYLESTFFGRANYLQVDGKPVVFVYNADDGNQDDGQSTNDRWAAAQTQADVDVYLSLKVYPGFRDTTNQPDSWHQYGPDTPYHDFDVEGSINVSPGFWRKGEATPRLDRDLARFRSDIIAGRNADADWKLVTSWNEWGEGTSVEASGASDDPGQEPAFFEAYLQILCQEWTQAAPTTSFDCSLDTDGDGFRDSMELAIGTDPLDNCADDANDDAWPADINNDGWSDGTDMTAVANHFGQSVPPAPVRFDIAPVPPDKSIDGTDLTLISGFFGQECSNSPPPTPTPAPTATPTPTPTSAPTPTPTPTPCCTPTPTVTPGPGFSFAAAGDHGDDSNATAGLNSLAADSDIEFYLALGDMSYNAGETAWCNYVKGIVGSSFPFELVTGNHEDAVDDPDGFIDNFAACLPDKLSVTGSYGHRYYFDYPAGNPLARIIMTDMDLLRGGSTQNYCNGETTNCDWLRARIQEAKAQDLWVIVGMHKNCITMGGKSCTIEDPAEDMLISEGVDLVLQGHEHDYQRSHSLSCAQSGTFLPGCIADNGSDGVYTRGAGTVFLIAGIFGRMRTDLDLGDPEVGYFTAWMDKTHSEPAGGEESYGYIKYTVTDSTLSAEFVPSAGGSFADAWSIVP